MEKLKRLLLKLNGTDQLLIQLYHTIDKECISETDTVKMESIKNIMIDLGIDHNDL